MRAAVLRELGKPLCIEDLEAPPLRPHQVLVRMKLAAVCSSQKLEVSGGRGSDRFLPHLIGHEGVGVILETGPEVTAVSAGDQVVLTWIRKNSAGFEPVQYLGRQGVVNAGPVAVFCETPVVSVDCVIRIKKSLDPEMAVLAGCAMPTGAGSVRNAMPAKRDGAVCIFGLGGVGLAAVAGAKQAGWGMVVGVDLHEERCERALEAGASRVVNANRQDAEPFIMGLAAPGGFDLVLECAGSPAAMEMAVRVAKPGGGKVVLAGNLESGKKISIDPFDLIRGRWVGGSWGGWVDAAKDIPQFVDLMEQGAINHRLLLGRRFSLEQVNEAIASLGRPDPGRPLIEFG